MPYYLEAANHHKIGGWTWTCGPGLNRHTGEKTALDKYIGAGGCWPGHTSMCGSGIHRWRT
ncbi:MAG: hypothetical protein V8R40_07755 [Dysosmobacter sp.]